MSHFTVMVITESNPHVRGPDGRTGLERALQPFHEFECTGTNDEYVQDVDITEEALDEWGGQTETRYRDPEGNLHDPYGDEFYRDPTPEESETLGPVPGSGVGRGLSWVSKDWGDGQGYRTKVHFMPEGWEKVEVPTKDAKSFIEWIEDWYGISPWYRETQELDLEKKHKYGYAEVVHGDVLRVIDRTNPNKQWDWWQLGGRWAGKLRILPEVAARQSAVNGEPGLMGSRENDGPLWVDSARKGDIDVDAMRVDAIQKANKEWDEWQEIAKEHPPIKTFEEIKEEIDAKCDLLTSTTGLTSEQEKTDLVRETYWAQPGIQAVREKLKLILLSKDDILDMRMTRAQYGIKRANACISTFAILKDGEWRERGSMGWWGIVSDEKDQKEWTDRVWELFESLPDHYWVTIVDCHV